MSIIDQDIAKFVEAVGAVDLALDKLPLGIEPTPYAKEKLERLREDLEKIGIDVSEIIKGGPRLFKRRNYFVLEGRFLIVKVSRSDRPFWGVAEKSINLFNKLNDYYLVLLVSDSEGWVFSKAEVIANIRNNGWRLRETDNNYKINPPLPKGNWFDSPKTFRKMIGVNDP